jgi:hypothetical protein
VQIPSNNKTTRKINAGSSFFVRSSEDSMMPCRR